MPFVVVLAAQSVEHLAPMFGVDGLDTESDAGGHFEHGVIKRANGQPSFVEKVLSDLGPKNGIEFTFSKDSSLFAPDYLAGFDAYMFYTSGDLCAAGKDGNPPMSAEGKAAFLDAIKKGMTLEQVKASRPVRDYEGRYGASSGFWTTDNFIEAVYRSISSFF